MHCRGLTCCVAMIFLPSFLSAQTDRPNFRDLSTTRDLPAARDVIDEYIEAIGSEMGLLAITTMTLEADFEGLGSREDGKMVLTCSGEQWHYDFQLESDKVAYKQIADGSVWQQSTENWFKLPAEDNIKFREIVPRIPGPLRWLDYDGEIELLAIENVNEKPCYQIEFRPKDGDPVTRFFDVDTKLLVRMSYKTNGMSAEWHLSDYQEREGFLIPLKREQHFSGSLSYQVITKSITINEPVDESLFADPESESQFPSPEGWVPADDDGSDDDDDGP